MPRDTLGNPVSGSPQAVVLLDDAVDRVLRHDGGVAQSAEAAIRADPTYGLARAVLALADPAQAPTALGEARRLVADAGTDFERSLVGFLDLLLTEGMWAAQDAGLRHSREHPRDLLGVGLAATIVERSTRADVHEAVLATYAPSVRALGEHPYLLSMVGFVRQEQGQFEAAGRLAHQALAAQPSSVTAAHLRAHVHVETADHEQGLRWLDDFRAGMDPRGDYVHHMGWHAALHTLALGNAAGTLSRLESLSGPECDEFRHVVDNGTLLLRCRLCGFVGPRDDPTSGLAGSPPRAWLSQMPSMYVGFHAAVGLVVQGRCDDLRRLAADAASMIMPGAVDLLAPLAQALAEYCEGDFAAAADGLAELRGSSYRWGGSTAQRDVVEDVLIDAAIKGGRPELATQVLTERTDRRPNRWDQAALRTIPRT
jgi:hypothetical protein